MPEPVSAPVAPAAVPVAGDPGKDVAEAQGRAREDAEASAKPPVAAAFDRAAVREITRMAIGRYWNHDPLGCDDHPAAERVTEAFWPLLEHAQAALADNEGVRLWMLDCGELVARHRARGEAAERKLAVIRAECEGRSAPVFADILAVIGSEEGSDHA